MAEQEMTLREYIVNTLPKEHLARREYEALLSPVTDEEVAGIEARHLLAEADGWVLRADDAGRTHRDRATLLRRDAQREAELGRLREALEKIAKGRYGKCPIEGHWPPEKPCTLCGDLGFFDDDPQYNPDKDGHCVEGGARVVARAALEPKS